jgi:hypothetical protein
LPVGIFIERDIRLRSERNSAHHDFGQFPLAQLDGLALLLHVAGPIGAEGDELANADQGKQKDRQGHQHFQERQSVPRM